MAQVSMMRKFRVPLRTGRSLIAAVLLAGSLILLPAGPTLAQEFSLEYGTIGVGGAVCDTVDYSVVDTLDIQGATAEPAQSADYQLAPLTATESAPPAGVQLWMFY